MHKDVLRQLQDLCGVHGLTSSKELEKNPGIFGKEHL